MLGTYLKRYLAHLFTISHFPADKILCWGAIVLGASNYLWDEKVPDNVSDILNAGVLFLAFISFLWVFFSAPYFAWKEVKLENKNLKNEYYNPNNLSSTRIVAVEKVRNAARMLKSLSLHNVNASHNASIAAALLDSDYEFVDLTADNRTQIAYEKLSNFTREYLTAQSLIGAAEPEYIKYLEENKRPIAHEFLKASNWIKNCEPK